MGAWRNNFSGPGTIILKALFLYNNSTRNSLLIHGFWPVNARLLIAYGTGFYAIIYFIFLFFSIFFTYIFFNIFIFFIYICFDIFIFFLFYSLFFIILLFTYLFIP